MIYLDNAATTMPKPPQVIAAVTAALKDFGNPSRGFYDASLDALRCMMQTRMALSQMFSVGDPMRVAFTNNATIALNIAIASIKGHIIVTQADHNSVLRPVYRKGNYTVVALDKSGRLDLNKLESAIRPDTEAVVMCHASNLTGNVFDINAAGDICRRKNIKFIVDAAQTAGLLPIDMQKGNISALCFSGHKSLYGIQGTGGICLGHDFCPDALAVGGSGYDSFSETHPQELPDALESGTQNAHGIAGLLAGVKYVNGMEGRIFTYADKLARMFVSKAENLDVTLYGDLQAALRTPVVCFNINGVDSGYAASVLWEDYNIASRAGAHCAPLMHKALGTDKTGAIRVSFSHFNTEQEIDILLQGVKEILNKRRNNYDNR